MPKIETPDQGASGLGPDGNSLQYSRGQDVHAVFQYTVMPLVFPGLIWASVAPWAGGQIPPGTKAGTVDAVSSMASRMPLLAQDSRGRWVLTSSFDDD